MPISSRRPSSVSMMPVWLRWMPFWHGLFSVSLVLATGLALVERSSTWQHIWLMLALSLGLGSWYAICVVISPLSWNGHPFLTLIYFAIGWMLWFGLTTQDPVYLFVLTGLYPQVFILPPLSGKILGACLLTALAVWQQVVAAGGGGLFLTLAAAISGLIMALFIHTLVEQSHQQHHLIVELEETRHALTTAERQAGIMEERQRLAREIHDTLAQGFASIVMRLEAAEATFPADLFPLQYHLDQARRIARENLAEARRLMWALQPTAFDQTSLAETLTLLATRWTQENGIGAEVSITGSVHSLRPEIEVTLLRAAQESLANARKYARASQVVLTLSYLDGIVVLDVQDDGIGFDTTSLSSLPIGHSGGGFGLKALRERAQQLGGTLTIESVSGEGTTIVVALPAASNEPHSLETGKEGR